MAVPAAALDALRHALDTVVERERPRDDPSLPTGLAALDLLLGGGLPRGRLSELQAPRGQGRTTLMRSLVAHTLASGRWVAIIDAQRTLAPADWARLASPSGSGPGSIGTTPPPSRGLSPESETSRLAVIRPADPSRAPWCADVLLRSGAYALVVLDGVPALPRNVVLRLTRLAHDRQVVFLLAGDAEQAIPTVGASVRLGIRLEANDVEPPVRKWRSDGAPKRQMRLMGKDVPAEPDGLDAPVVPAVPSTTLAITVAKGGPPSTMRLPYVITSPRRLGCHADVPDRRGVARSTPLPPKAAGPAVGSAGVNPVARAIGRVDRSPHARRAAESRYGRGRR